MDSEQLQPVQDKRLRKTVRFAYERVPLYRERLDDAGITPEDILGVDDLPQLPFTTKEDFRAEYPDGLVAVEDEALERLHASSGTTGKPKIVAYTDDDLAVWGQVMERTLRLAGLDATDRLQNAFGYGLFTGGLGVQQGAASLGANVIPIGGGHSRRQVKFLRDLEASAIAATPSYALRLIDVADDIGIDLQALPVDTVIYGAEPCTDPMREAIEAGFDATAIDIYGLSELIGPGVASECHEAQTGLHVFEDHFYPEVIDPETGHVIEPGEIGELVLTSLSKEALPVLRYRTGDLTRILPGSCDCGRPYTRIDTIRGRSDDMLTIRGVNFYPTEIEAVILAVDAVAPHYRIDVDREGHLDRLELVVELREGFDDDETSVRTVLTERLRNTLSFRPDAIDLVAYGTLERSDGGKVQRVYDHRT